jgi:hypothetical protein
MGMYDYLKISTNKLPLSDSEKLAIGENPNWQTKDFECKLSTAEITDDGKLKYLDFRYEWDENIKSRSFELTGKLGGLVTKDEHWIELNDFHGYIRFYGNVKNVYYEFKAKFTDGQLVNIERVSRNAEREPTSFSGG